MNHLKSHHISIYSKIKVFSGASAGKRKRSESFDCDSSDDRLTPSKQPKISTCMPGVAYDKSSSRWKSCTNAVAKYIVGNAISIYTVEKKHFRDMLSTFDSRYEVPGRRYFSETAIPRMYADTRERVCAELADAEYIALTSDMWSSVGMTPYLGVTAHFIDKDWRLQTRCLQTLFFPQDHNSENIADGLVESLENWSIPTSKLSCITTDNAANVLKAVDTILSWPRISCFGHNLNLAVTNSYKNDDRVKRSLSVCRTIVSSFSYSHARKKNLAAMQTELNLPRHQLIADCCTRWGTAHAMASRFLEQEQAIRRVLSDDRKCAHLIPRYNDVQVLEAVKFAFDPVSEMTDILSAQNYVTFSAVLPLIKLLETKTLDTTDDTHTLKSKLKNNIREYISGKYSSSKIKDLIRFATYIDPRFKCENLSSDDCASVRAKVISDASMHASSDTVKSTPVQADSSRKVKKTWSTLFGHASSSQDNTSAATTDKAVSLNREISSYESVCCINFDNDPLDWWRLNAHSYPTLAKYARKYLCIPATSVPSERVFSLSGAIVTPKRSLLKPEMVNMLTFLAANMQ